MTHEASDAAVVNIVDDDAGVREALHELFCSMGRPSRTFASALDFLERADRDTPGCILSDVRLPQLGGLAFQSRLPEYGFFLPVILMSGHADVQMAVRGLKAGAHDFLLKPLCDQDVLDATDAAIEIDRQRRVEVAEAAAAQGRFECLSPRELQALALYLAGRKNREVAEALGLSEITAKIYRGHGMKKMNVRSLQELSRLDQVLGGAISTGGLAADSHVNQLIGGE